jgi:anti-sigma regulatory factor (Ser/Thr protein kinase)
LHELTELPVRTYRQRPGPAIRDKTLMLDPVETSVGDARATVHQALTLWGLQQITEPALAITSELVTNAIATSRKNAPEGTEPAAVTIRVTVEPGELCIRVWDPDPTPPPADPSLPDDLSETGRGLFIVKAFASRWGWHPGPNGGKYVCAAISLDAPSGEVEANTKDKERDQELA